MVAPVFLFFRRTDLNIEVLKQFVQLHEFENMILVQALRSAPLPTKSDAHPTHLCMS